MFSVAPPFLRLGWMNPKKNEAPLLGLLFSLRFVYPGVNALATEKARSLRMFDFDYLSCLGGGWSFESSEDVLPVSANISLMVPTLESIVEVSTGMKITFALLLFVMSRK